MPKRVYISLTEATETHRRHPKEAQPPTIVKAQNVYPSPADHALTVRPDLAPAQSVHVYKLNGQTASCGVFRHPVGITAEVRDTESRPLHVEQFGRYAILNAPDLAGNPHGPFITAPLSSQSEEPDPWPTSGVKTFVNMTNSDVQDKPFGRVFLVLRDSAAGKYLISLYGFGAYQTFSGADYAAPAGVSSYRFTFGATNNSNRAVVGNGALYYTTNYSTFTRSTSDRQDWKSVCWAGPLSKFCAVGSGVAATSVDGTSFSSEPMGTFAALSRVIYSVLLGKLVAVGEDGTVATSSDGASWDIENVGESVFLFDVAEDSANCLVAVSASGMYRSEDGSSWDKVSTEAATQVVWTGSQFIAATLSGLSTSPDGVTWSSAVALPFGMSPSGLWYVNSIIFCQASVSHPLNGFFAGSSVSSLQLAWPQYAYAQAMDFDVGHVRIGNTMVAYGPYGWLRTVNLTSMAETIRKSNVPLTLRSGASFGGLVAICGDGGTVLTSSNSGTTWSREATGVTADLVSACWAADGTNPYGRLIAVGDSGTVVYSTDGGSTWASASGVPSYVHLVAIAWKNGTWLALGANGAMYSSTDGETFAEVSGVPNGVIAIAATNQRFVALTNWALYAARSPGGIWENVAAIVNAQSLAVDGEYVYVLQTLGSTSLWRCQPALGTSEVVASFQLPGMNYARIPFVMYVGIGFVRGYYTGEIKQVSPVGVEDVLEARLLKPELKAAAFASVDGQVLLFNVTEDGTKYGRRARWSAPGTYDVFDPDDQDNPGAGFDDYVGTGEFIDARTLGHNVIVWETSAVSVFSQTGFLEAPWEYRRLADGIELASNPVAVNDTIYFIAKDGLLYVANSVSVKPASLPFDLTKFSDFSNFSRAWLAYEPRMNALCIYSPGEQSQLHIINLSTGFISNWTLPLLDEDDGPPLYATSVSSLPSGTGSATLFVGYAGPRLTQFSFGSASLGRDIVPAAGEGTSSVTRQWHAEIEMGELPLGGERNLVRILQVAPRVYYEGTEAPRLLAWLRDGTAGQWVHFGDTAGTATATGTTVTGTNTTWSTTVAEGDGITTSFAVPYWVGLSRFYIDSAKLVSGEDYTPVDEGNGPVFTKTVELSAPLPTSSTLFQYWENPPRPTVSIGDVFSDSNNRYFVITDVVTCGECEIDSDPGTEVAVRHHYAKRPEKRESDVFLVCNGVCGAPQLRIVVLPAGAEVAKVLGVTLEFVAAGNRAR